MAIKQSKNNVANRSNAPKVKMVTSYECENCKTRCAKGENYLNSFKTKNVGRGVSCKK